jgi:hypothetical protein
LRFVQELGELDPYDLKTLAQFDLLADPSAHPVQAPIGAEAVGGPPPRAAARRLALEALGAALASTVPRAEVAGRRVTRSIEQLSADLGFITPAEPVVRRYDLRLPPAAAEAVSRRVSYTVLASRPAERRRVAVIVREEAGRPATYRTVHSR